MSVTIRTYSSDILGQYERLLQESPVAMFNHSLRYREFLKAILPEATDHYLCAFQGDELVAVLPTFIKEGPYGAVVNSLPFYGSHGGFVSREHTGDEVFEALILALKTLCEKIGAFSCTLIESPWDRDKGKYDRLNANLFDDRIGQITQLPTCGAPDTLADRLLRMCHQKTRNVVRKGMRGGFDVSHEGSASTMAAMHAIHEENILAIGGLAKPLSVFQSIANVFVYNNDYRLYIASKGDQIISALLVFYFKDTVEYFCPATVKEYRSAQPLSLLVFTAMQDSILERGSRYWNWGGTWLSQTGVYQFKARWGAMDFPYRYHLKVLLDAKFSMLKTKELLRCYEYFYTIPFHLVGTE